MTPLHNPSGRVYIAGAIIGALAVIIAAYIGRASGIERGVEQTFRTAAVQQTTAVAQGAITQIIVTELAVTRIAVTEVVVTEIVAAGESVVATATSEPPTTISDNTPSGSILEPGQTWKQNGVELTLIDVKIEPNWLRLNWLFTNHTGKELLVTYGNRNFSAKDNLGNPVKGIAFIEFTGLAHHCPSFTTILKAGESVNNALCGNMRPSLWIEFDMSNPQINEIIVTAVEIARIEKAQWRIPIELR